MDGFKITDVQMVLPEAAELSDEQRRALAKRIDDAIMAVAFPPAPPVKEPEPPCPDCRRMGGLFVGCAKHMIC
jgi:hypothetical protein